MYGWYPRALLVATALVLVTRAYCQTSESKTGRFTSSSGLVLVPTVVNDKSGNHVAGLSKDDFVVKQDGKPYAIAVFEEVKTSSARLHRTEGERGTFSNFEPGAATYHRLGIIVLDFVNTPPMDQSSAKRELLKFLLGVAESGEPMCLLALTRGGLKLIHDFTDDPKILAKAVRDLDSTANPSDRHVDNPAPLIHERVVEADHISADAWNLKRGGILDDKLATNLNRVISNLLQEEGRLGQQVAKNQAFITVDAMRQISKAFGGFPGRKSLIWVSSGFPFSLSAACPPACANPRIREVRDAYDNLWKMMNDAQIAIYSVDLRLTSSNVQAASQTNFTHPYDVGDPVYDVDAQTRSGEFDATSSLVLFAENTGGKAFLGGGNLIQSFQQSVQDDSSYYVLGYYVKPDTKPGWHGISVAVHAKGAQVRHRNGFLLSRDISATSARQDIELALRSPLDFASLPVSVTWLNKEPDKQTGKTKVEFDLVMPANFAAVDESDQNHMVVDVVALARNTKGDVAGDLSQRIDEHLKADGLEQIRKNGMTYHNALELPPGDYDVRFVVRDSIGNRVGSVAAPVTVAP